MSPADAPAVSALYAGSARDALSPQERAEHGFVQSALPVEALTRFAAAGAVLVAEVDGVLAGAVVAHPAGRFAGAGDDADTPPAQSVALARRAGIPDPVLYGPVVVDRERRGQGVVRALLEAFLAWAREQGATHAVAFMETENTVSQAVHQHLGWEPLGPFTVHGRGYEAVVHPVPGA